jgi:hypothetical protein
MTTYTYDMPVTGATDWGIDRIAFTYPVDESQSDSSSPLWSGSSTQNLPDTDMESICHRGEITIGHAAIDVRLYSLRDRCRVEFNPSRVLTPKGRELCLPEVLPKLVGLVLDEIRHAAWPTFDAVTAEGEIIRGVGWEEQVLIRRLDVARNFDVVDPEPVKLALEQKQPKYGKQQAKHSSAWGGWSITNTAPKSGKDTFYDKGAELALDSSRGASVMGDERLLRFETVMKEPRLKAFGLKTLDRVTVEACWSALSSRWKATQWGTPISLGGDLCTVLRSLPYADRAALAGYLFLKSVGADEGITSSRERRMRKIARDLGLTPGLPLDALGEPSAYLDLSTGCLETWVPDRVASSFVDTKSAPKSGWSGVVVMDEQCG